jgi:hypothetical protein
MKNLGKTVFRRRIAAWGFNRSRRVLNDTPDFKGDSTSNIKYCKERRKACRRNYIMMSSSKEETHACHVLAQGVTKTMPASTSHVANISHPTS